MNFDSHVSSNYDNLLTIAKHITKSHEKAHDLVSDTYLHLKTKSVNIENQDEFVKFYRVCMKNLYLNSLKKPGLIYKDCERVELIEQNNDLINELDLFKKSLPLHEMYLYELYFEEDMNCEKIRRLLKEDNFDISSSYIKAIVIEIKSKLKNKWK